MKKLLLFLSLYLGIRYVATAQTPDEWLRQKETQKKYLLQQIAALKIYIDYAEDGYEIANKGLAHIKAIKNGDFDLHQNFFQSLEKVNPQIAKYSKLASIVTYQIRIVKQTNGIMESIRISKQFAPEEIEYYKDVFNFLLAECLKLIDELIPIITSGELRMKDDERIKYIDRLYKDVLSQYSFSCSLSNEILILATQRVSEQAEINQSKILNGVK